MSSTARARRSANQSTHNANSSSNRSSGHSGHTSPHRARTVDAQASLEFSYGELDGSSQRRRRSSAKEGMRSGSGSSSSNPNPSKTGGTGSAKGKKQTVAAAPAESPRSTSSTTREGKGQPPQLRENDSGRANPARTPPSSSQRGSATDNYSWGDSVLASTVPRPTRGVTSSGSNHYHHSRHYHDDDDDEDANGYTEDIIMALEKRYANSKGRNARPPKEAPLQPGEDTTDRDTYGVQHSGVREGRTLLNADTERSGSTYSYTQGLPFPGFSLMASRNRGREAGAEHDRHSPLDSSGRAPSTTSAGSPNALGLLERDGDLLTMSAPARRRLSEVTTESTGATPQNGAKVNEKLALPGASSSCHSGRTATSSTAPTTERDPRGAAATDKPKPASSAPRSNSATELSGLSGLPLAPQSIMTTRRASEPLPARGTTDASSSGLARIKYCNSNKASDQHNSAESPSFSISAAPRTLTLANPPNEDGASELHSVDSAYSYDLTSVLSLPTSAISLSYMARPPGGSQAARGAVGTIVVPAGMDREELMSFAKEYDVPVASLGELAAYHAVASLTGQQGMAIPAPPAGSPPASATAINSTVYRSGAPDDSYFNFYEELIRQGSIQPISAAAAAAAAGEHDPNTSSMETSLVFNSRGGGHHDTQKESAAKVVQRVLQHKRPGASREKEEATSNSLSGSSTDGREATKISFLQSRLLTTTALASFDHAAVPNTPATPGYDLGESADSSRDGAVRSSGSSLPRHLPRGPPSDPQHPSFDDYSVLSGSGNLPARRDAASSSSESCVALHPPHGSPVPPPPAPPVRPPPTPTEARVRELLLQHHQQQQQQQDSKLSDTTVDESVYVDDIVPTSSEVFDMADLADTAPVPMLSQLQAPVLIQGVNGNKMRVGGGGGGGGSPERKRTVVTFSPTEKLSLSLRNQLQQPQEPILFISSASPTRSPTTATPSPGRSSSASGGPAAPGPGRRLSLGSQTESEKEPVARSGANFYNRIHFQKSPS